VAAAVAAVKANEALEALEAALMVEEIILPAAVDKQTLAVAVEDLLNIQTTCQEDQEEVEL
jgi:hypothetical protein